MVGYRNFCNKLWNITKFALGNFPKDFQPESINVSKLSFSDKWILTRLSKLIDETTQKMDEYDFGYMVEGLYDFWLKELADYYIESMKPVMNGNDEEAKKAALNTLYIVLDTGIKMLHPVMPYITEELFQRLPHDKSKMSESITIAEWPKGCISFEKEGVEDLISDL